MSGGSYDYIYDKMSGGSYDYMYDKIDEYYVGKMYNLEMDCMMKDLVVLLKALEWWKSSDKSERDYLKEVVKFKDKWFTGAKERKIHRALETLSELKEELESLK